MTSTLPTQAVTWITPGTAVVSDLAAEPESLLPARNQMAFSLGFHIILACFGMALPAMILAVHRRGLRGDGAALELAKRWSKVAGVLFAIGAVTGTVLSFEMGLLWPELMGRYGDVLGLAFALEGISFFAEAIFLGIYVYGWGRLPGRIHSLMLLPIVAAGVAGSFFVVSVNAWMNAPTGFSVVDGEVVDVDPVAAMLNEAAGLQFLHMFLGAYMVTGFGVAAVYASGILRGRHDRLHRLGLRVPLVFAAVATVCQPVVGHLAGQRLAEQQPIKLAAMEGLAVTEASVPVVLGGIYTDDGIVGGIELPIDGLASFLATNDFDDELIGLGAVPAEDRPPVNIVRFAFQIMVGIGTALVGLVAWAAWRWFRRRDSIDRGRWFLRAVVVAGPAAVIALEAGWITTEVGRQPWVVHQELRTVDAVTDAGYLWLTFTVLVVVYAATAAAAVWALRSMSRRWADGQNELATPYGPVAGGSGRLAAAADDGATDSVGTAGSTDAVTVGVDGGTDVVTVGVDGGTGPGPAGGDGDQLAPDEGRSVRAEQP
jgi:cytochrome d ubiquinol oxidase subunit I